MAFTFSTNTKNGRANAITTEAGTGPKLQIYTTAYGTKLVEFTWTGNAWASASGGAMSMNTPTTNPVTPLANGTAAIARLTKTDGTTVVINDLTVGTSGTNVVLSSVTIDTGVQCQLNSFTITEAA